MILEILKSFFKWLRQENCGNRKKFFEELGKNMDPYWNVIYSMDRPYESGHINVGGEKYSVMAFKRDLFPDLTSKTIISITNPKTTASINIGVDRENKIPEIWYYQTIIPDIRKIKDKKELEYLFGWSDIQFEEFYREMTYLCVKWV